MNRFLVFLAISLLTAAVASAQTGSVNTSGTGTSGVYIETTSSSFPDVGIEVIDSLRVFNSSDQDLLRVYSDGKVAVGLTSTTERFHIFDNADRNSILVLENPNTGLSALAAYRAKADVAFGSFNAHASTRTITRFNQALGGWMELLSVAGNGLAIGTLGDVPMILGTNNADRVHILGNGDVGVGTAAPTEKLHVFENADTLSFLLVENPNTGTSAAALIRAKSDVAMANFHAHASTRTVSRFGVTLGGWTEFLSVNGNGFAIGTAGSVPMILGTNSADRIHITPAGDVGINKPVPGAKLHVGGNLIVDGDITGARVINAVYQDMAEWVVSDEPLDAATVVIVAPGKTDQVVASTRPYDTRVAGVVSAQPGVLLGVPGESKLKIATTGRVRVRVDATAGPIEAGDILVTSGKPGVAMKSVPIEISGVQIHRPGTVVGKALEALAAGEGEILVLLSLQ
ncbi:MAG TPA: hypothetical protein VGQ36_07345 [Thermoanaerobaculia bacterium]|jgi:hypothetical protein|nr:hypothetical protein [Thermoanaerobaculia bacterium]